MLASDGTLHFSDLKRIAAPGGSPLHYAYALSAPRKMTDAMEVGTAFDSLLMKTGGRKVVAYEGAVRRGKEWEAFHALHARDIVINKWQYERAAGMHYAVTQGPESGIVRNSGILDGEYQVPMTWEIDGIPCSTGGVDVLGVDHLADIKSSYSAQPERFQYHAEGLGYDAQLAWYYDGAVLNGRRVSRCGLLVVESRPPYPLSVIWLTPAKLDAGRRKYHMWLAAWRAARDAGAWSGYAQAPVTWDDTGELTGFVGEGVEDE